MKQTVLSQFQWPLLTCFALLLFLAVFVGMLVWIFRKDSGSFYKKMASFPILEDKQ